MRAPKGYTSVEHADGRVHAIDLSELHDDRSLWREPVVCGAATGVSSDEGGPSSLHTRELTCLDCKAILAVSNGDPKRKLVREWLLGYAWLGTPDEQEREVDCILSQNGWQHISALADSYAGAQFESGPAAFNEGVGFALSSLYECHTGPHLDTCPRKKD